MSKTMKNTLIIIVIMLLAFAIILAIYEKYKSEPINTNEVKGNILPDANTGLDNMLNTLLSNETIENTNKENNVDNEETTETEDDNKMTPREEKAIKLAKDEWKKIWGNLDDVAFNVSVQSDGKYGVTVYDTITTQSIQFYIVDVDTGIVKER